MEYIDPTAHETLEVLACDSCYGPAWVAPFIRYPELKVHYCDGTNDWQWGYYGSDVTWQDAGEALNELKTYRRQNISRYREMVAEADANRVIEEPRDLA